MSAVAQTRSASATLRRLPRCDLALTGLGLGCAPLAGLYQAVSEAEARDTVRSAWALGLRYFDTAPLYGHGLSEHRLGAALREWPRDEFVVSTKVGRLLRPDLQPAADLAIWAKPLPFRPVYDYSRSGVLRSFEDSLQRLGLARIDILLVHDIGRLTHGEQHDAHWRQLTEQGGFAALEELRRHGDVRAFGLGVNETEVVETTLGLTEGSSNTPVDIDLVLLAGRYTLLEQRSLGLMDECQRRGVAVVLGGPFNSGILAQGSAAAVPGSGTGTGTGTGAGTATFDYGAVPPAVLQRVQALEAVCQRHGVPLAAAALQFVMAHAAVVSCIPGGRDAAQMQQNVAWFESAVAPAFWHELKALGLIDPGAPTPVAEPAAPAAASPGAPHAAR